MEIEDSDEEVRCVICGSDEPCRHIVADIDRTYCEVHHGALYERDDEFRSKIEDDFLRHIKAGTSPTWRREHLNELWKTGKDEYDAEWEHVPLDGLVFYPFVIELLEEAGAIDFPGSIVDPGGPGMTSAVSLLYAEEPTEVVNLALEKLGTALTQVSV